MNAHVLYPIVYARIIELRPAAELHRIAKQDDSRRRTECRRARAISAFSSDRRGR